MHCEAIHCPDSETVRFAIYPEGFDGPRIIARVDTAALHDYFGAESDAQSLVQACDAHFGLIEAIALQRYQAAPHKAIVLAIHDFGTATTAMAEAPGA